MKKEAKERIQWGSQVEFFLTMVSYAVGLGNVWRFPYLAYKSGGGAFFIPYFVMLAFVGMPVFFLEISFGQYCSLGPVTAWKASPLFKGLGMASVTVAGMVGTYYNVIVTHALYFMIASMKAEVPWATCDHEWNTDQCVEDLNSSGRNPNETYYTPSEEYFYNQVLNISSGIDEPGGLRWELAGTLAAAWIIVFLVLIKGVRILGKVVYFIAIFPYIMLTALIINGATLEGAGSGILYYVQPTFERLSDITVWRDAAVQIFFSLSACAGGLIAMASFNKFDHNIRRDAILVPIINCFTSIYAGFAVFAVLGFMAQEKGVDIEDVAEQGPGLVFVVYPEALAQMPLAPFWSILFFFMIALLGFGSEFSMMETVMTATIDEFPHVLRSSTPRTIAFRFIVCLSWFLIGLTMVTRGGQYVVTLVDETVAGIPRLLVGLLQCVALQWVYGFSRFADDIEKMIGWRPSLYWHVCWKFLTPLILTVVILMSIVQYTPITYNNPMVEGGVYYYPDWCIALEWGIVAIPLSMIVGMFFYRYCKEGGLQLLKDLSQPTWDWGPAIERNVFYKSQKTTQSFKSISEEFSNVQPMDVNLDQTVTHELNDFVADGVINPQFDMGETRHVATVNHKY